MEDETRTDRRVYVACPVMPSPAVTELQGTLVSTFPDVVPCPSDELHVTVGHVGKAHELRGEIEAIAGTGLDPVAFRESFARLLDALRACAVPAHDARVTGLGCFGHARLQLVATIEHSDSLERGRAHVQRSVVAMLEGLRVPDGERVARGARSLELLWPNRFRPHVTLAEWKDGGARAGVGPALARVPMPAAFSMQLGAARLEPGAASLSTR